MAAKAGEHTTGHAQQFRAALASSLLIVPALYTGCAAPRSLRSSDAPASELWPVTVAKVDTAAKAGELEPREPPIFRAAQARETPLGDVGLTKAGARASAGSAMDIPADAIPPANQDFPIDLTTALRLAEAENPLIAEARQRIGEALAVQQGARSLLLPSLNIGTNFHAHTGNLQRPSGRILNLNEQSLYFGGGVDAIGAGTLQVPAVVISSPLTDAIFEPLAARQHVVEARYNASATANTILLDVAERHFELLAAQADLAVGRETASQADEVVRLTRAYATAGQGREADAQRAASEFALIMDEVRQAEEDRAVAAARLAERLHLDQSVRLSPIAPAIEMVTIVDPTIPLPDLIHTALDRRPEFRARAAALGAAETRHRQERYRPFLPTLWLGFSAGAFGGGSNLVSNDLSHFAGRTDSDVMVYWTLQNFGLGNLALQKQRSAEAGQAAGQQARIVAEIRSQVSAAYADVMAARRQVDVTTQGLESAELGFREDVIRIRNTVGRPLEVVNSLQLLNRARLARIRAVIDYNKAQFRLFVNLGSPPPLGTQSTGPTPRAPIATPPLPPLAGLNPVRNVHGQ